MAFSLFETRTCYLHGLRREFIRLRHQIKNKCSERFVMASAEQLKGFLYCGFYMDIISEKEYYHILDIISNITFLFTFKN